MSKQHNILFVGLHATGKTTYIAALWYMLVYNASEVFELGEVNGDDEYLYAICDKWMSFEDIGRTLRRPSGENVSINVIRRGTEYKAQLRIPDFSGETFNDHFDNRVWNTHFNDALADTTGLLLFINPQHPNNRPQLIVHEAEFLRMFDQQATERDKPFQEYLSEHTPNQVKLVDELQLFERYGDFSKPVKLAIIISSWDVVEPANMHTTTPWNWLKLHMPLLSQYCQCNSDIYDVMVYGISAQGGDYKNRVNLARTKHTERVFLKDNDEFSHDILRPIIWVTE